MRREVFKVDTRESGTDLMLALFGELDLGTIEILREELERLNPDGPPRGLVIDLRELEFLDSTGLRLLLDLDVSCQAHGERLRLVRGGPAVHKLFQVTATDVHFYFVEPPDAEPPSAGTASPSSPRADALED